MTEALAEVQKEPPGPQEHSGLAPLASFYYHTKATTVTPAMHSLYIILGATSCTKAHSVWVDIKLGKNRMPSYCCYAFVGRSLRRREVRVLKKYFTDYFVLFFVKLRLNVTGSEGGWVVKDVGIAGHPLHKAMSFSGRSVFLLAGQSQAAFCSRAGGVGVPKKISGALWSAKTRQQRPHTALQLKWYAQKKEKEFHLQSFNNLCPPFPNSPSVFLSAFVFLRRLMCPACCGSEIRTFLCAYGLVSVSIY